MTNIAIDKDVPLPDNRRRLPRTAYPFSEMQVGDSFAVPVPSGKNPSSFSAHMCTAAYQWGRTKNAKFSVRIIDEKTKVRVWRIA
jgi:hypothetical protein